MPLFPVILDETQYHIMLSIIILPLMGVFLLKGDFTGCKKQVIIASSFFVLLQFLLLLSLFFGKESLISFGDFFSLFRPLTFVVSIVCLIILTKDAENCFFALEKTLTILLFIILAISIIEVFLNTSVLADINYFLYKLQRKMDIAKVSVSVFVLPYYVGYALSFFISYFMTLLLIKRKIKYVVLSSIVVFISLLAQSKTGIMVNVAIFIFGLLVYSHGLIRYILLASAIFIFYALFLNIQEVLNYIAENYPGNFSHSIQIIINDTGESYTLNERLAQFAFIFNGLKDNYFLTGYGLGRDLLLESWIVTILVRYGIVGLFVYLLFSAFLIFKGFFFYINRSDNSRYISLFFIVWIVLSFISQLSAFMNETSKTAYIFLLYLAIFLNIIYANKK